MRAVFLSILFLCSLGSSAQQMLTRDAFLMGGRFDITIVAKDSATASRHIDSVIAEITRIENLISDWKPESQVSLINRFAGVRPVRVDSELLSLTERALAISKITDGAFDISFGAMDKIWKFDGSMTTMPTPAQIKLAVAKVGYKNIILNKDSSTIFLRLPGMKIGFGALGEGYAADRCKEMMTSRGVKAGIINATGDIRTWGKRPDGEQWNIGVNDPFNRGELLGTVAVTDAITTSGSYEKYTMIDGKRYSHIINPATGYPATGLISVTVKGASAEVANALSTSIMVLGQKKGLRLLKRFPGYACLMITDKGKTKSTMGSAFSQF